MPSSLIVTRGLAEKCLEKPSQVPGALASDGIDGVETRRRLRFPAKTMSQLCTYDNPLGWWAWLPSCFQVVHWFTCDGGIPLVNPLRAGSGDMESGRTLVGLGEKALSAASG